MAKIYTNNNFAFRIDKVTYISMNREDLKLEYFIEGCPIKLGIVFSSVGMLAEQYDTLLKAMKESQ